MNLIEQAFENVCSFLFDSPKEKQRKKLQKLFNTRIIDCCDGKVSYDSLSICEKIAFNLYGSNDATRNAAKILELLLSQARAAEYLIHLPIDNEFPPLTISREISILVESKILNPARRIGLEYLLDLWDGANLDAIRRYAQLIVGAHYLDRFIEKFSEKAVSAITKKSVMEICAAAPNMGYKRSKYWKHKIGEINRAIREEGLRKTHEEKEQEALELDRRFATHRKSQGLSGGYAEVKTGDDYERYVMFCVKDFGSPCKKVGGTGDYGADLVADVNGKHLVIQCKFYSTPVGYDAVQQVYAAKSVYKGTWCCVVSNASFTRQAIIGARKLGVRLLSHADIAEYLRSLK